MEKIRTPPIIELLAAEYALQPNSARLIGSEHADRLVYHITIDPGAQLLVRLYRDTAPPPPWLDVPSGAAWLQQQATVLEWCARHGYSAPRVQRTRDGSLVSQYAGWHAIVTEFIGGAAVPSTGQARGQLALLLGQLHQYGTTTAPGEFQALPWSWWAPIEPVTSRIQTLLESVSNVPAEWLDLVDTCHAIFQESVRLHGLPESVIHGDPWTGNAVAPTPTESILIDWEYAGRGLALLDLGCLLSDCFGYPERPAQVDGACVAAVMDGYSRFRKLPAAELDVLPIALRFGAALRTTIRCYLAREFGWVGSIRRGLLHEQARIAISDQIASRARAIIKSC